MLRGVSSWHLTQTLLLVGKGVDFECLALVVGQLDTDAVILTFHDWESVIGFEEVALQAW